MSRLLVLLGVLALAACARAGPIDWSTRVAAAPSRLAPYQPPPPSAAAPRLRLERVPPHRPAQDGQDDDDEADERPPTVGRFHPIVVWHGLGDSAKSPPMTRFVDMLRRDYPGVVVHSVFLEQEFAADQRASFYGEALRQVDQVCEQLRDLPELAAGFDAVGFSQGGILMRAYIERCNEPRVRNLVTFGSPHQGVSEFPRCATFDVFCRLWHAALRGGAYTEYAQTHVVPAQYLRDPAQHARYLDANRFLTTINGELERNATHKANLASLENFVMVMFGDDKVVMPKQSAWFSTYAVPNKTHDDDVRAAVVDRQGVRSLHDDDDDGGDDGGGGHVPANEPVPLRQSEIYLEDRIGLRSLDGRGALRFELCGGGHMAIDGACWAKVAGKYVGTAPPSPSSSLPADQEGADAAGGLGTSDEEERERQEQEEEEEQEQEAHGVGGAPAGGDGAQLVLLPASHRRAA